jgi:hypothetical protein
MGSTDYTDFTDGLVSDPQITQMSQMVIGVGLGSARFMARARQAAWSVAVLAAEARPFPGSAGLGFPELGNRLSQSGRT